MQAGRINEPRLCQPNATADKESWMEYSSENVDKRPVLVSFRGGGLVYARPSSAWRSHRNDSKMCTGWRPPSLVISQ